MQLSNVSLAYQTHLEHEKVTCRLVYCALREIVEEDASLNQTTACKATVDGRASEGDNADQVL